MRVTPDCVDPDYGTPVVDSETTATDPVPHVRVSGHFAGTSARFSIYLPTGIEWEHRFYQLVYPLQDENATAETIALGAASGAYTVQTNGGSGYRVDAAAAKFAETVAANRYGWLGPIHGYIYGASGGSYQTIAAGRTAAASGTAPCRSSTVCRRRSRTTSSSEPSPGSCWRTTPRRSPMR
jgi:hypothetical protein